jgi:hypothetical protein
MIGNVLFFPRGKWGETLAGSGFREQEFLKKIWAWVETLARF